MVPQLNENTFNYTESLSYVERIYLCIECLDVQQWGQTMMYTLHKNRYKMSFQFLFVSFNQQRKKLREGKTETTKRTQAEVYMTSGIH